jgi:hypothetical protein
LVKVMVHERIAEVWEAAIAEWPAATAVAGRGSAVGAA